MPGADYQLIRLLGLRPSVKRVMLYDLGCYAGGTVLRVAKDLAENNAGARVLVVCSESTVVSFHGPDDTHFDNLVGQALFGDGAAALVVGADVVQGLETPCFQLLWSGQTILPESEGGIEGHLREAGLVFQLLQSLPRLISDNIEAALEEAFRQLAVSDWNDLLWIAHPGGSAILNAIECKLQLDPNKLRVSKHVLSEYGNMWSACVRFILDEMRKASQLHGYATTGEGLDLGVLVGFGPGLTMETVVLKSVRLQ